MSEIIKEMAETVLTNPKVIPSSEAAHVALLLSHIGWNRANGFSVNDSQYTLLISEFEASNYDLWKELKSKDCEEMILQLMEYKKKHYPKDLRKILVFGVRGGNVHVEWVE
ncbi:MAG: hypothetical protein ACPLYF_03520 [Fervidobacterium sp.]